jgi:hypothetical protein
MLYPILELVKYGDAISFSDDDYFAMADICFDRSESVLAIVGVNYENKSGKNKI